MLPPGNDDGRAHVDGQWRLRRRLERVSRILDSAVRVPGLGIRVGVDAPLNLIPGLGWAIGTGLSAWVIWEATRLRVPRGLVLRMLGNISIDAAISAVPVVGWLGDLFFRANDRNMALLRDHLDDGHPFRRGAGRSGVIDGDAVRLS